MNDKKLIRLIEKLRVVINLITSLMFIYLAYDLNRPISMHVIGWLLLIGWILGAWERNLLGRRRRSLRKKVESDAS
jgi:hypothetical protein